MRIVIPVTEATEKASVSSKFGRSPFFVLVDKTGNSYEFIENPFHQRQEHVGRKVLEFLVNEKKINSLLAFELGLKVQQIAIELKLQLIIIEKKEHKLKQLFKVIGVSEIAKS